MAPPKARVVAAAVLAAAASVGAQCDPAWTPLFAAPGVDSAAVQAAVVWDDGHSGGPSLYAIGAFSIAGDIMASGVARWDGSRWSALGEGLTGGGASVVWKAAAAVPFPGAAAGLYVAADFQYAGGQPATPIVRWDGQAWSSVPGSQTVPGRAMIGFDPDGAGPQPAILYAGTRTWDGEAWTSAGLSSVWRYRSLDLGAGPALYAAGAPGGVLRQGPGGWNQAGPALEGVIDVAAFDPDGPGSAPETVCVLVNTGVVYALAGGQWLALAPSAGPAPYALTSFDFDGSGPGAPVLLVALDGSIVRLSGSQWTTAASFSHPNCSCAPIYDFTAFDPPGAAAGALIASGYFRYAEGAVANGLCQSTPGGPFLPLAPARGLDSTCDALLVHDEDGPGPAPAAVFAGGLFALAGMTPARGIARWDGQAWSPVGGGVASTIGFYEVTCMTPWDDDGPGPNSASLVIAGRFNTAGGVTANGVASWDGAAWRPVGVGAGRYFFGISSLKAFDEDGAGPLPPMLFAAGSFTTATGVPARGIARWDGAAWSAVGTPPWAGSYVRALAVYDPDGAGPAPAALYAGTDSGAGLYRWDGASWATIPGLVGGSSSLVTALAVGDEDGPGPLRSALFIGGAFSHAGGAIVTSMARFDGQVFSPMGPGLGDVPTPVDALGFIDWTGGAGAPTLYAGGVFFDHSMRGLAMWHAASQQWLPVGYGAEAVRAIAAADGPAGPALYLGGAFREAGSVPAASIARFTCAGACWANCDGSTLPPLLNVADFICFQQRFAAGDARANCDGSLAPPVLNVADFVCFQQRFAAGCP